MKTVIIGRRIRFKNVTYLFSITNIIVEINLIQRNSQVIGLLAILLKAYKNSRECFHDSYELESGMFMLTIKKLSFQDYLTQFSKIFQMDT